MSAHSTLPTRLAAFFFMVLAAVLGLATRKTGLNAVPVIGTYGGDVAWAMAAYALVRMCAPKARIDTVMLIAGIMALGVELSQLIDAQWINDLRQNAFVALIIGKGFLWSDLGAYIVGVLIAALINLIILRIAHARSASAHGLSSQKPAA